jgi:AraC-like DNA-binding protein
LEFQLVDLLRLPHPAQNSLEECRLRSGLTLVVASLLEHLQTLGIALEAQEIHDQRLLKAMKILESQSCPGPLPWPKLLQETGMSRSGLERLFSRRFSQNLTSWHESRIMEHITSALADPHKSIASIATQFGFQDPSNFNRWFRRITGTSPGRYRHNVQGS